MCDCIKNLNEQLKPSIHEQFSKSNKAVQHFHIRATMSGKAIVNITINIAKQIKPVSTYIVADFCPWCGAKY
jgi:hypothetical protein